MAKANDWKKYLSMDDYFQDWNRDPPEEERKKRIREEYQARFQDVYEKYAPNRLKNVETLLDKYAGKEHKLYMKMCTKYGRWPLDQYSGYAPGNFHEQEYFKLRATKKLEIGFRSDYEDEDEEEIEARDSTRSTTKVHFKDEEEEPDNEAVTPESGISPKPFLVLTTDNGSFVNDVEKIVSEEIRRRDDSPRNQEVRSCEAGEEKSNVNPPSLAETPANQKENLETAEDVYPPALSPVNSISSLELAVPITPASAKTPIDSPREVAEKQKEESGDAGVEKALDPNADEYHENKMKELHKVASLDHIFFDSSDSDDSDGDYSVGGEAAPDVDHVKAALESLEHTIPVPDAPREVSQLMRALTFSKKDFEESMSPPVKRRHSRAQSIYVEDKNLESMLNEAPAENVGSTEQSIRVVCRFRPPNEREKREEFVLMIMKLFHFDKKDFEKFDKEYSLLTDSNGEEMTYSIKEEIVKDKETRKETINRTYLKKPVMEWKVDDTCKWIEQVVGLKDGTKFFRKRKVDGPWLLRPPPYAEEKPLEIDMTDVIHFSRNKQKRFELDGVLDHEATQAEVYDAWFAETAKNVVSGINTTLFAYGQTGTGKTHTMFGPPRNANTPISEEDLGVIPRCIGGLLQQMKSDGNIKKFDCHMSVLEIYQEKLKDLLNPFAKLSLRFVGRDSKVDNLSWWSITSVDEAMKYITQAQANRVTAATSQNQTSSRSHCIITVKIEVVTKDKNTIISKLNFGDLAGSERVTKTGAKGRRLKEATNIVKSLFALKTVIRGLAERKAFVPYQNSVLTKLLRDSLGGNCFTTIITTATLHEFNRSETVSTLRFGETAKKITNKVEVNRILSRADMMKRMNQMQDQLDYLANVKSSAKRLQEKMRKKQTLDQELQEKFDTLTIDYALRKKEIIELKHDQRQLSRELTNRDYLIDFLKRRLEKYEPNVSFMGEFSERIDTEMHSSDSSDSEYTETVTESGIRQMF